jgi:tRNA dimethylallyltransferase
MQVYRGLDIGTAKPSKAECERIPHHLVDVVDLSHSFDAAQFVRLAAIAVEQIHARGRLPIFCGGTGLYFKAFLEGLGRAPAASATLRSELETMTAAELLRELSQRDPITYERIDRNNLRRVVRALEVIRLTGEPFSAQRAEWAAPTIGGLDGSPVYGLVRPSADLHRRIEERVDTMFSRGLIAETEALLKVGLKNNRTALQAIGYRQAVEYLENLRSRVDTISLVKTRTRQFAKRQMTWFRRQLPMRWITVEPGQSPEAVAERIAEDSAADKAAALV